MFFQNGTSHLVEDIEYICKLMHQILKLPIYFLDNNKDIFLCFSYGHIDNPIYSSNKEFFISLLDSTESLKFPVVKSTRYYENYLAVNLYYTDMFIGTIVAGPSTYSPVTAETIDKLLSEKSIPLGNKKNLINFYNSIAVIDYTNLINWGLLLYYSIYNERLDVAVVIEKNSTLTNVKEKINHETEKYLSKNRQKAFFHHSLTHEKNYMNCIKQGDVEKLKQVLIIPLDGEPGILSKNNPLRSQKNTAICLITLATRAAIEGGLDSELAFSLSDSYIQTVEEITEIKDLVELQNKALLDFAARVAETKAHSHPKVIIQCQKYISKHLYEYFPVSQLAKFVNLNQNYLSELFTKSVGKTISEYILEERVNEAKRLLESSSYSLLDISTWLNFHDQSHFTRTFKKFTGITPKKYRDSKII